MDINCQEVKDDLKILKLEDKKIEDISIREVIIAYRNLARSVHPDTSGYDSKADFQALANAYERILGVVVNRSNNEVISKQNNQEDIFEDDEEKFVRENFKNFNFPTEKDGNFVVIVQNQLADAWADCFESIYGTPKINTRNGNEVSRLWKIMYKEIELTVHFYNKPKSTKVSKFLVQGRDLMAKNLFVFNELPSVYKSVCTKSKTSIVMIKSKPETGKTPYRCNQCKVTSRTLADLRKHTKTKHKQLTKLPTQVSTEVLFKEEERKSTKRLPVFTPIAKPPKRCKPEQIILAINNEEQEETTNQSPVITLDENLSVGNLSINESIEDLQELEQTLTKNQEINHFSTILNLIYSSCQ